jgi:hypothetical protein
MNDLLADVGFASLVGGANETTLERQTFKARVEPTPGLQFLAVIAACVEASDSTPSSGLTPVDESGIGDAAPKERLEWQDTFKVRTQRPEKLQRELRSRLGKPPPTAFEALSSYSPSYLGWIEQKWIGFVSAHEMRAKLIDALAETNPETAPPAPFSVVSHAALWQSIATKAGLSIT